MFTPTTEAVANLTRAIALLREAEEAVKEAGVPSSYNLARDIESVRRAVTTNEKVWASQV